MGWFGWPPQVALATDVNLIEIALTGRLDLLTVMGLITPKDKPGGNKSLKPSDWEAFKKTHNMRYRIRLRQSKRQAAQARPDTGHTRRGD